MKALRIKAASELDNPSRWNRYLKPWFDVERFQQQINDRVGLNKDGRPIVRLVWGQDVLQHIYSEETPRYWLKRTHQYNNSIYYTVARFVFERRLEPEQYIDSWNATRYSLRDPATGTDLRCGDCGSGAEPELIDGKLFCRNCVSTNITGGAVIDKGPPPDDFYIYMMDCSEHEGGHDANGWPWCCSQAYYSDTKWGTPKSRCWGTFRLPSDFDLEVLSQTTRAMESDKYRDPYRPLSPAELMEVELAANKQVERADEQIRLLEQEIVRENVNQFIRQPHSVDFGANTAAARSPFERELAQRALQRINDARTRQIT